MRTWKALDHFFTDTLASSSSVPLYMCDAKSGVLVLHGFHGYPKPAITSLVPPLGQSHLDLKVPMLLIQDEAVISQCAEKMLIYAAVLNNDGSAVDPDTIKLKLTPGDHLGVRVNSPNGETGLFLFRYPVSGTPRKLLPRICPCGIDSRDCDYHK